MLAVSYISRVSWVWCLLLLGILVVCANIRLYCDPVVAFVRLHITRPHYNHYADLSECIELLKILSGRFCFEGASMIKSFFQLSLMQYMGLCVFCLPISRMMILRIHVLHLIIIIKSKYYLFAIFLCYVMKQWYALYVFLYFYDLGPNSI